MPTVSRTGIVLIVVGFVALVAASITAVVVQASGTDIGIFPLVVAGLVLVLGALLAAATAAHAFIRHRWGWGAALIVMWPVSIPFYLRNVYRASAEAEV